MKYILFALQVLIFVSCSNHETKKESLQPVPLQPPARQDSVKSQPLSFFDSVARQDMLSVEQIKMHTRIDSSRYSEPYLHATFRGDSVFKLSNGYRAVILQYFDGMATVEKYLFIYNPEG